MHLKTIARNTAIRDAAISASEKTGIWQLALGLLAEIADDTMQQDTKALECTVTLIVRCDLLIQRPREHSPVHILTHGTDKWQLGFGLMAKVAESTVQLDTSKCRDGEWQLSLTLGWDDGEDIAANSIACMAEDSMQHSTLIYTAALMHVTGMANGSLH